MDILSIMIGNLMERNPIWRYPEEKREFLLSEIMALARNFATRLALSGVAKGDRVGVLLENGSGYAPALVAIWSLEAVAVPLRATSGRFFEFAPYLQSIHRTCGLRALIVEDPEASGSIGAWSRDAGVACLDLARLGLQTEGQALEIRSPGFLPSETALIQYSSGSTGNPKGVVVTHGMMLAQLEQINAELYANCRGKLVRSSSSWLPFNHDMGLFIGLLNPLYTGADNLLGSPKFYMMRPKRWFSLMAEHKVDLNFTTDSAMRAGLRAMKQTSAMDLSGLYICLGAEKVHASTLRECYRVLGPHGMTEANFRIGYGMAENTLGAASTKGERIEINRFRIDEDGRVTLADEGSEIVSIGRPQIGTRITIADAEGRPLPEMRVGQILIEGACVMGGYYNNPEASRRALDGSRLRTGDLGFLYQGELYFHSRQDDLLIVGGQNIVPDDVEAKVEELDFVRPTCTALLGLERDGGTELVLLVEVNGAASPDGEGIRLEQRRLIQRKAFEACRVLISNIVFCETGTIEKTSSGKKRRKAMSARIHRSTVAAAAAPGNA